MDILLTRNCQHCLASLPCGETETGLRLEAQTYLVHSQVSLPPPKVLDITFILLCGSISQYTYITSSFRALSRHSYCLLCSQFFLEFQKRGKILSSSPIPPARKQARRSPKTEALADRTGDEP